MLAQAGGCSGAYRSRDGGNRSGETRPADSGPAGSKSWSLSCFTGVEAAGPYDVTIRQGDIFAISATGTQEELDQLEIETDGSQLPIERKRTGSSEERRIGDE